MFHKGLWIQMKLLVMYLKPCILLLATYIAICLTSLRKCSFGMRRLVDFRHFRISFTAPTPLIWGAFFCTHPLLTGVACFLLSLFAATFCPPIVVPSPFWFTNNSDDSKEAEEFSTSLLVPAWLPWPPPHFIINNDFREFWNTTSVSPRWETNTVTDLTAVCKFTVIIDVLQGWEVFNIHTLLKNRHFSRCNCAWLDKTRCQIWCTIEFHRDPISKVLSEW